jgi:hypothetical protein
MPVIPVNREVDTKRVIGKKWRAEEEEQHKGSLTKKNRSIVENSPNLVTLPLCTYKLNANFFSVTTVGGWRLRAFHCVDAASF